jgi:polyisoprenoid-binding protein YceI
MMLMNVRGSFEKFTGVVDFDENDLEKSKVSVQIEAASLNTLDSRRDDHLRSPDFLDVENYPNLTFKSQRVERTGDKTGKIYGDLTLRGEAHPVVLDAEFLGTAKSPWGATSAGFRAHTKINRRNWGLNWNVALETGGWLVGDEINIDIEVELIKQPEAEQASAA